MRAMSPPPFVVNSALSDLSDTWLRLTCCRGTTYVPVRHLASSARPNARLRNVLARLRCAVCDDVPLACALVEFPALSGGRQPGWVIALTYRGAPAFSPNSTGSPNTIAQSVPQPGVDATRDATAA